MLDLKNTTALVKSIDFAEMEDDDGELPFKEVTVWLRSNG